MRGRDTTQYVMLTLKTPEQLVPKEHPLRRVKTFVDEALREMSGLFDEMYSDVGRPSIPPEQLIKATLLMAFYTVRSERLFCEQLGYNLWASASITATRAGRRIGPGGGSATNRGPL